MCISLSPNKTDTPLIVDPNTVLAFTFTFQCFKSVGRWNMEIVQAMSIVQHTQFSPCDRLDISWQFARKVACPYLFGLSILEARDHEIKYNDIRYITSSVMGRYFLYRMPPFSIVEILTQAIPDTKRIVRQPGKIKAADFRALWQHGGYPEPFLKRDTRFARRWQSLRLEQLVREDIRDLTQIQQIGQLELLVKLLARRSAQQLIYGKLAKEIRVSVDTLRRWVDTLCNLHLGFLVRPWFRNVSRSLRKEPKWFLRDWSSIEDAGSKAETFVACHLIKAVDGWNDMGLGSFELGYLRDKEKHEVDFLVVRDGTPWFLVEVKHTEGPISPTLKFYQDQLKAPFAFQLVLDRDYVDADCFARPGGPVEQAGFD